MNRSIVTDSQLSRRSLIRGSAGIAALGAFAAMGLSACSTAGGVKAGTTLRMLLPGDAPKGWDTVLAAVNKKLTADLGFTIKPQFISWTNYAQQELLKFTSGEKFDTALEAGWLHLSKLHSDGALADLTAEWNSTKYPDLKKSIDARFIKYRMYKDKLYAIPQVASVANILGFVIRQDLADKYGMAEITTYEQLEKYFYTVKQKDPGLIPFGLDNGYVNNSVAPGPTALFNSDSWDNPSQLTEQSSSTFYDPKKGFAPVPMWEQPGVIDGLKRVRKYSQDGIINTDVLTLDRSALKSLFTQGRYASTEANTDGLTTPTFAPVSKNVPGAAIAQVMPFTDGTNAKVATNFSSANNVVVPRTSGNVEAVMQLQNWLSVQENHDLLSYGVKGTDWAEAGTHGYKQLGAYAFPGFAVTWRTTLERDIAGIAPSDKKWSDWAKNFDNFTTDPLSGFTFDQTPVSAEMAQLTAANSEFAVPLFAGVKDVAKGLSDLKSAFEKAGYEKIVTEYQSQAVKFSQGK